MQYRKSNSGLFVNPASESPLAPPRSSLRFSPRPKQQQPVIASPRARSIECTKKDNLIVSRLIEHMVVFVLHPAASDIGAPTFLSLSLSHDNQVERNVLAPTWGLRKRRTWGTPIGWVNQTTELRNDPGNPDIGACWESIVAAPKHHACPSRPAPARVH
jgi:hypothetical protein